MTRLSLPLLAALLGGCSATIAIQTEPISQDIPFQSVGIPAYSEIAVDMPDEARSLPESITVESLVMTGAVVNPMRHTSLELGLRLSFEGTAIPGAFLQHPVKPLYYDRAQVLLASRVYPAAGTVPFSIPKEPLLQIFGKKRIYILINNTVQNVDLRDSTPQLKLQNVVIQALITKDFRGLGPGGEAIGL